MPDIMGDQGRIFVGLMSGTSLDGISAAVARFRDLPNGRVHSDLLGFTHRAYRPEERARLEQAMQQGSAREYCRVHADVGDWMAEAALAAMADAGVTAHDVAAVASHGQTLWHEPGHSTWQVGDGARIAERTGCDVVSDFRSRDVAAGGQGAPLVTMADCMLFAHDTQWRALQNIGGIGNVTVVPPANTHERGGMQSVRAFDTGPGVVIIDAVVRALYDGQPYDRDGLIAAGGQVLESVVSTAMRHPYFSDAPPKSTGRELFSRAYVGQFIDECRAAGAAPADIVATATALTARSLADQYRRFIPEPVQDVVLSGGGAHNPTLVRMIESAVAQENGPQVCIFDGLYFDGEAKEAVAFALLGYLHLSGRAGNVPSATGARGPRPLGSLTPAVR
ncbi:anhydro-N-acetylmuramic acid kinase [Gemmatimonas groenlandica]|uniref:Anhydro-N-acetylmuramic acid kinase n=1 Tax=Gemmatimonas groenlandica TaxID=2732249 RepID=A0A6M4IUM2_9BACT|nr:anhydro-N-acetylmuramic acid kinase [Gemmatimonas groenlandica]QJR35851.1 anhydro-N-acetylmuramic acid kinase [Gemmatimonas groenlandica]